jgi:signal transduction histidine kinase
MKDFTSILFSYIKKNIFILIAFAICSLIFALVFLLYDLPSEAVTYASWLSFFAFMIIAFLRFFSFYKKHNELNYLKNVITVSLPKFPQASNKIEKDYQELLTLLYESKLSVIYEKDNSFSNMMDYYTMWAHQIKTPIAAMRLILQSNLQSSPQTNLNHNLQEELLEQLFRTEQYVEMVLQYLRMESDSSDLLIRRYPLDSIVKQAVKKYAKLFIRKKIKLNYEDLNIGVITDEKWLCFAIEQLLSNALKYTYSGSISIYMDEILPESLVIEDTGIGIQEEDLPRVFEKGFTGYNGRADKKSTGIGLFLCKKILKKLSHTISIESTMDKGTKVKIGLDMLDVDIE